MKIMRVVLLGVCFFLFINCSNSIYSDREIDTSQVSRAASVPAVPAVPANVPTSYNRISSNRKIGPYQVCFQNTKQVWCYIRKGPEYVNLPASLRGTALQIQLGSAIDRVYLFNRRNGSRSRGGVITVTPSSDPDKVYLGTQALSFKIDTLLPHEVCLYDASYMATDPNFRAGLDPTGDDAWCTSKAQDGTAVNVPDYISSRASSIRMGKDITKVSTYRSEDGTGTSCDYTSDGILGPVSRYYTHPSDHPRICENNTSSISVAIPSDLNYTLKYYKGSVRQDSYTIDSKAKKITSDFQSIEGDGAYKWKAPKPFILRLCKRNRMETYTSGGTRERFATDICTLVHSSVADVSGGVQYHEVNKSDLTNLRFRLGYSVVGNVGSIYVLTPGDHVRAFYFSMRRGGGKLHIAEYGDTAPEGGGDDFMSVFYYIPNSDTKGYWGVEAGTYAIRNMSNTSNCWDNHGSVNNQHAIGFYPCITTSSHANSSNLRFHLALTLEGYRIIARSSGKCLTANSDTRGSIEQTTCGGFNVRKEIFELLPSPLGNDTYTIHLLGEYDKYLADKYGNLELITYHSNPSFNPTDDKLAFKLTEEAVLGGEAESSVFDNFHFMLEDLPKREARWNYYGRGRQCYMGDFRDRLIGTAVDLKVIVFPDTAINSNACEATKILQESSSWKKFQNEMNNLHYVVEIFVVPEFLDIRTRDTFAFANSLVNSKYNYGGYRYRYGVAYAHRDSNGYWGWGQIPDINNLSPSLSTKTFWYKKSVSESLAHEVGHTLGLDHDDSSVRYHGGWWYSTFMTSGKEDDGAAFRKKDNRYSTDSRRKIHTLFNKLRILAPLSGYYL